MSIKYLNKVFESDLLPRERLICLAIADCADDKGIAWPGYKHLMKKTGYTKPTISAGLKELKNLGWITVQNNSVFGEGKKVNIYTLHDPKVKPLNFRENTQKLNLPKSKAALLPKVKSTPPKSKAALHETPLEPPIKRKPPIYKRVCLLKPDFFSEEEWKELYQHRSRKKAAQTERAYSMLVSEFQKAHDAGLSANDILNAMSSGKGWSGFKYEWVEKKSGNGGFQKRRHTTIDAIQEWADEEINSLGKEVGKENRIGADNTIGLPLP